MSNYNNNTNSTHNDNNRESNDMKTISEMYFSDFARLFEEANRVDIFSLKSLEAIFGYLQEVAPDSIPDVIDICCEFVEMSAEEIGKGYGIDVSDLEEEEREEEAKGFDTNLDVLEMIAGEKLERVREFLEDNTLIINIHHDENDQARIVFQAF